MYTYKKLREAGGANRHGLETLWKECGWLDRPGLASLAVLRLRQNLPSQEDDGGTPGSTLAKSILMLPSGYYYSNTLPLESTF